MVQFDLSQFQCAKAATAKLLLLLHTNKTLLGFTQADNEPALYV